MNLRPARPRRRGSKNKLSHSTKISLLERVSSSSADDHLLPFSASAPAGSSLQTSEQRIRSAETPPLLPFLSEEGGAAVH